MNLPTPHDTESLPADPHGENPAESPDEPRVIIPRRTFPLSGLGKAHKAVQNSTYRLRKHLEAEVIRVHGGISMTQADLINVACKWEQLAQIADSQIAKGRTLTPVDTALEAAKATERRSAAIRKLELVGAQTADEAAWAEVDEGESETVQDTDATP